MADNTPQSAGNAADSGFNAKEYNKIVGSAELQTIQVQKVAFDVSPEFHDSGRSKKLAANREELGAVFDADSNAVAGRFKFSIVIRHGRSVVLKGVGEYIVIYQVHEGAEEQAAIAFCNRVGVFAAYPYFRALVAHLSWEANTRLPPLPVIATRGSPVAAVNPPAQTSRKRSRKG